MRTKYTFEKFNKTESNLEISMQDILNLAKIGLRLMREERQEIIQKGKSHLRNLESGLPTTKLSKDEIQKVIGTMKEEIKDLQNKYDDISTYEEFDMLTIN